MNIALHSSLKSSLMVDIEMMNALPRYPDFNENGRVAPCPSKFRLHLSGKVEFPSEVIFLSSSMGLLFHVATWIRMEQTLLQEDGH